MTGSDQHTNPPTPSAATPTATATPADSSPVPADNSESKSWLLPGVEKLAGVYRDYLSFQGQVWLYEPLQAGMDRGETRQLHRKLHVMDAIWVGFLAASILSWCWLWGVLAWEARQWRVESDEVRSVVAILAVLQQQPALADRLPVPLALSVASNADGDPRARQLLADWLTELVEQPLATPVTAIPSDQLSSVTRQLLEQPSSGPNRSRRQRAWLEDLCGGELERRATVVPPPTLSRWFASGLVRLWFAMVLFRLFDAFMAAVNASPFGAGAVRKEIRNRQLHRRLILLNLITIVELIFWNGSLLYYLEQTGAGGFKESFSSNGTTADALAHALQTSMSTLTTIGYGTYGPNTAFPVCLAILQTVTGLILVSIVASSALSLTLEPAPPRPPVHPRAMTGVVTFNGLIAVATARAPVAPPIVDKSRYWMPVVGTVGLIFCCWLLLWALQT